MFTSNKSKMSSKGDSPLVSWYQNRIGTPSTADEANGY